jgi:hypothetical protein
MTHSIESDNNWPVDFQIIDVLRLWDNYYDLKFHYKTFFNRTKYLRKKVN